MTKYLDDKEAILADRTPRVSRDGLTVRDTLNSFLAAKQTLLDGEELTHRTFNDYHRPKTAIDRRCKLWPGTLAAVKALIAVACVGITNANTTMGRPVF